ncbi:hypothetical protein A260_23620, partial [Pseudomonas syringae pv. actinidiae ICMP 19068]
GQTSENGSVGRAFSAQLLFALCCGDNVIDCRLYVVDRSLIRSRRSFRETVNQRLNAGGNDQLLFD